MAKWTHFKWGWQHGLAFVVWGATVAIAIASESGLYEVIEGDILLRSSPSKLQAMLVTGPQRRWPNAVMPYVFDEELPPANRYAVFMAMDYWERHSNVTFVELTPLNREQYPDYVTFVPHHGRMCASFVGRQGGRQDVQLSTRCDFKIVLHEIGHAVGLWHEQSRADRDNYVRIIWQNITTESRYNFEKRALDGVDFKEYDYQSIMHYSPYAFSKNGEKTIEPLFPGVEIGQQNTLSPLDIEAVYAMYPGPLG